MTTQRQHESKTKLLDAALHVIRSRGYAATTVDDICHQAGVTKGSFFHHFKSKDELALDAVAHWGAITDGLFAAAPYHQADDPLDRVLGYIEFRGEILTGELPDYTCLLGTLIQETYATHPAIRAACDQGMSSHIAHLTRDIEAAKKRHAPRAAWSPQSVGYFIHGVLQGSFIFAKSKQSPEVVRANLDHLRRYLKVLFNLRPQTGEVMSTLTKSVPDGMHSVTPHLVCEGAADAIEFYKKAFNATELSRLPGPNGKVMHASIRIGDSTVMLVDDAPSWGMLGPKALKGSAVYIHLYVDDVDMFTARAVAAGAKVTMPVADMFWGDRYGRLEDPFGHRWSVATHVKDVSLEDMRQAMAKMSH
jgi:TetR/AcrR family transcriptional regulator, transcriptional repressor for nem operon